MKHSSRFTKIMIALLALILAGIVVVSLQRRRQDASRPAVMTKPAAPPRPHKEIIVAKGLHVTGWIAGGKKSFQKLIDIVNSTEINALCIDIKDSDGVVSFDTHVPLERQINASRKCIRDIESVMKKMEDNNVYPIARIACFKDPILAGAVKSMAVQTPTGGLWTDHHGIAWANPYDKRVWDYNIDIAIECAKLGFKEIQWDYVRFPSDGRVSRCAYPGRDKRNESQVVEGFLKYARERLEPYGVVMSADIFGLTSLVKHDMGIGQTIKMIAKNVDYICPMVYPSHYALGEYHIANPNKAPYRTVFLSLGDAVKKMKGTKCKIRPWLQDFSLYGVHYGPAEINAQRKAARKVGLTEFLLWNPRCKYTTAALASEKGNGQKTAKAD